MNLIIRMHVEDVNEIQHIAEIVAEIEKAHSCNCTLDVSVETEDMKFNSCVI